MTALRPLSLVVLAAGAAIATLSIRRPAVAEPPSGAASSTRVIAWSDLGMHCEDDDFSVFSLLPPFNTLVAQVVRNGDLVTDATGLSVTYEAVADPAGSINTTSIGKGNFWSYVQDLFGVTLAPDQGLAGNAMPGPANVPQPMTFERRWRRTARSRCNARAVTDP